MDELKLLESAGEDVSDLRADLESLLGSNRQQPTPDPTPVRSEPAPTSFDPEMRLPIDRDGNDVKLEPRQSEPTPQPQQQVRSTQEQALDPYKVDAPKTPLENEPGEIEFDAEGKLRDAKTGRYVPHAAMHKERERRKELEAEVQRIRDEHVRAQERLNVLNEIIAGQEQVGKKVEEKAPEPEADIDAEQDIFAAVNQLKKRLAERDEYIRKIEQTSTERLDAMQTTERYRQDAVRFQVQQPDFADAYRYTIEMRRRELQAFGEPANRIEAQIAAEENAMVRMGFNRPDKSPAKLIYELALARGYQPKPKDTPAPAAPAPAVQQTAPAPVAAQPAPVSQSLPQVAADAAAQVRQLQNGVQASASLSGAGGKAGDGMTLQDLVNMGEEEFVQFAGKMGAKKLDRLLGWKG